MIDKGHRKILINVSVIIPWHYAIRSDTTTSFIWSPKLKAVTLTWEWPITSTLSITCVDKIINAAIIAVIIVMEGEVVEAEAMM